MRVLLLSSSSRLDRATTTGALDQLGVGQRADVDVVVLSARPPIEPLGVSVLTPAPAPARAGGSHGRAAVVTLAWNTSRAARRAFREADVVVALDGGTHQAAWLLAQQFRRPAVVAGAAAGRRVIDAASPAS